MESALEVLVAEHGDQVSGALVRRSKEAADASAYAEHREQIGRPESDCDRASLSVHDLVHRVLLKARHAFEHRVLAFPFEVICARYAHALEERVRRGGETLPHEYQA